MKGNTERVIIRRERRAAGDAEVSSPVALGWRERGESHTHAGLQSSADETLIFCETLSSNLVGDASRSN